MVVVVVETSNGQLYMDGWLHRQCLRVKKRINETDDYKVLMVDGRERVGKSVFVQGVAKVIDPSFTEERMCQTAEKFEFWMTVAEKGMVVVYDEAYTGLGSDVSRSRVAAALRRKLMTSGQLNICVIIVIQKIWKLEPYTAIEVSEGQGLIHVYSKMVGGELKLGYWVYFDSKQKELIYYQGKKHGGSLAYDFKVVGHARKKGRFLNQYVIDEEKYRKMKRDALSVDPNAKSNKYREQRDVLLRVLHSKTGMGVVELSELCKSKGFAISKSQIATIVNSVV